MKKILSFLFLVFSVSLVLAQNPDDTKSTSNALELMVALHQFKTELKELRIAAEADILSMYIELLSLNGQLSGEPYTNYLSREQTTYQLDY